MALISIVIPVLNEQESLQDISQLIFEELNPFKIKFEIIFIDDGSTDNSLLILKKLQSERENIKVISFTRNFGHQSAISAGIDHANGDAIVTMDADFQDPPSLIPKMVKEWEQGAKVVFTNRKIRKDRFLKKLSASIYYWLLYNFSDIRIKGNIADYRLIDKEIVKYLKGTKERSGYLRGVISWLGYPYVVLDYERPKRKHGKTKYSLLKMTRLAMDGILNFSLVPVRLGFVLGLLLIPLGLCFMGYIIYDTLINDEYYPLYKWISVANLILMGFLFVLIWIVAEYIGKIYDRERDKPQYVIKEKFNIE